MNSIFLAELLQSNWVARSFHSCQHSHSHLGSRQSAQRPRQQRDWQPLEHLKGDGTRSSIKCGAGCARCALQREDHCLIVWQQRCHWLCRRRTGSAPIASPPSLLAVDCSHRRGGQLARLECRCEQLRWLIHPNDSCVECESLCFAHTLPRSEKMCKIL